MHSALLSSLRGSVASGGLEPLGGRCVFASEINATAQETYRANFGRDRLSGDIIDQYAHRLPPFDLLTGGFPCQPFSQ